MNEETTVADIVRAIRSLKWPLPREVFYELVKKAILPSVELLAFDTRGRILLTRRPLDDPEYPGEWHTPGCVIMDSENIHDTLNRLYSSELPGVNLSEPVNIGWREVPRGERWGEDPSRHGLTLWYVSVIDGVYSGEGKLFPVDTLPDNTITHHQLMIREVVDRLENPRMQPTFESLGITR